MDTQLILSTYLSLALDEDNTLQHHDEVEHGGHYDPATMSCKLRDEMEADTLSKVDDGSSNHGNPKPGRDENGRPCGIGGIMTGSGADYKRPSLSYVNSGEGTQMEGWGLYGSNNRKISRGYSLLGLYDKVSHGSTSYEIIIDGNKIEHEFGSGDFDSPENFIYFLLQKQDLSVDKSIERINNVIPIMQESKSSEFDRIIRDIVEPAFEMLKDGRVEKKHPSIYEYEQTFFTNREPGDESHLLMWHEPVSDDNKKRVVDRAKEEGIGEIPDSVMMESKKLYEYLENKFGSARMASEFLVRADIDGVKYKSGFEEVIGQSGDEKETSYDYVSFRDDNICVNRKFKDGVAVSLDMSIFQMKGKNRMDNIAFDEDEVKSAATAYLDMVNNGVEKASDPDGGKNPLMELTGKDETDPKIDELDDFFDQFDMHTPLTDKEKEILERGVNDEAIDKMRELVKDAEVAGEVEQMEYLQKMLDSVEKCRAKGLLCGYIKIDKDTGEIVRGSTAPVNDPSKDAPEVPWDEGEYESDTWRSDSEADPEGGDVDPSSEQQPEEVRPEEIAPEGNEEQPQQTESAQPAPWQTQSPTEAVNPPQPQTETQQQVDQPQEQPQEVPQEVPQDQPAPEPVPVDEDEKEDDGGTTATDSIDAETARRLACWYRY